MLDAALLKLMDAKDYYAVLGLKRTANADDIKRTYRKLARKYHPDVSKEADAEERFKSIAEAYEVLGDADARSAYDAAARRPQGRQKSGPPPGWDDSHEFGGGKDFQGSAFFDELFRRQAAGERVPRARQGLGGGDQHAKARIDLEDSYRGGTRMLLLSVPQSDAQGLVTMRERQLEVRIPKGIRDGQHLRLAGQGDPGLGSGAAGDLYLEINIAPDPHFRVDGRDVYVDMPVAPWEAILGAAITVLTPDGSVQLTVPAGSTGGRKLRLKGRGIPCTPAGDLYVLLSIVLPPANVEPAREAYRQMRDAFADFNPRRSLEA